MLNKISSDQFNRVRKTQFLFSFSREMYSAARQIRNVRLAKSRVHAPSQPCIHSRAELPVNITPPTVPAPSRTALVHTTFFISSAKQDNVYTSRILQWERAKGYRGVSNEPGTQFTKYLKFIARSTYDSDLKSAKISFRYIVG